MWVFLVFGYFAIALVGHWILCNRVSSGSIFSKFLWVGGLVGLVLSAHTVFRYGIEEETFAIILVYAFLAEFYIFFFSMISGSISVSLLLALEGGSSTRNNLGKVYAGSDMVLRRLKKLYETGLLMKEGAAYIVTAKGQRILELFCWLRVVFRQKEDE